MKNISKNKRKPTQDHIRTGVDRHEEAKSGCAPATSRYLIIIIFWDKEFIIYYLSLLLPQKC